MEELTPSELIAKITELRKELDAGLIEPHERRDLKEQIKELNQILNDKL